MARTAQAIARFDKITARAVQQDALAALEAVAKKHGIKFSAAGGTINSDSSVTFKFEAALLDPKTGEAQSTIAVDFKEYSTLFGVPKKFLNKKVTLRGESFKLIGLMPRSRSYPFVVQRLSDNKQFKYSAESIKRALGIK